MNYPKQAAELTRLLQADQKHVKAVGYAYFHESDREKYDVLRRQLKRDTQKRTKRMFQILDEIGEPSIANISAEAAQAVSILATHDGHDALKRVLDMFTKIYERDRQDAYYQAIPAMTDWVFILEHKQ